MTTFDTISRSIAVLVIIWSVSRPSAAQRCSTRVTANGIRFLGCKEQVRTESLTDPKTPRKTIYSFKGIPYAEPPVGRLRFRKPVAKVWPKRPTLVDARRYGRPCMQPWLAELPFRPMSENCLFLNIWTPSVNSRANLPVMFWIYGGAFSIGSGSQFAALYLTTSDNIYMGSELSLRDVVVVTINYRLGIFGFLYANSSDCPGNQAFWDQALALKWVKDNIRAFGGDPNQITLFGESAGSISITNHMVSNYTRNLFQRVILQSGTAYIKLMSRDPEFAYETARRFVTNDQLFLTGGCGHTDKWVDCLRRKSAAELLTAQVMAIAHNSSKPWYTVWIQNFCPIFGDEFVPISINRAVREGNIRKDIKVLMGHNEMEGGFFTMGFDLIRGLQGRYNPFVPYAPIISKEIVYNDLRHHIFDNDTLGEEIARLFTKDFPDDPRLLDRNAIRRAAVHAFGDYFLTCPTVLFGAHMVENQDFTGEVYQYRLTYAHSQSAARFSTWSEVTHTDELPLIFGSPFRDRRKWTDSDRRISKQMMDVWTHFAKNDRVPTVNGNQWPKYEWNPNYGLVNASYLELHSHNDRMGRLWLDKYREDPNANPKVIGDCFYLWDDVITGQF